MKEEAGCVGVKVGLVLRDGAMVRDEASTRNGNGAAATGNGDRRQRQQVGTATCGI